MWKKCLYLFLTPFFLTFPLFAQISVEKMSLEEKVGQLLVAHFHGEIANEEARTLIQEIKVGGIIYYNWANGLTSPQQVSTLSQSLQKLAQNNPQKIPLFISVDQEGGRVARLKNGFTAFPSNQTVADTRNPQIAEEIAFAIGEELHAVGINLNFAPVVDVNVNPENPVIGTRSFGSHPNTVVDFGKRALEGYRRAGTIATLKHFPGHGDVEVDSHYDLPIVNKSLEELRQVELLPFAKLAAEADMIMTAHLLVPALDPDHCSTLSEKTLSYLRDTLHFKGPIITDSLVMKGVLKTDPIENVAIEAFLAGCDLLLLGGAQLNEGDVRFELSVADIQRIHTAIVNAVKKGLISHARLDQAVERIIALKERYGLSLVVDLDPALHSLNHQELVHKVLLLAQPSVSETQTTLFSISCSEAKKIGEKIWKNESAGRKEGLTHWNQGENFASLGIGHFIWYPQAKNQGKEERFKETFPLLLKFLEKEGATLPAWIKNSSYCPWNSREEFLKDLQSPHMQELRQFLFDTKDLQALFMVNQMQEKLSKILQHSPSEEKKRLSDLLDKLTKESQGMYALIDYINFKGDGLSDSEAYNGQGWGLLQVLREMPPSSQEPIVDFVASAKTVLTRRVDNSPPERNEKKWLPGWINRLDTYLL